jgi:hypothetical protein
MTVIMRREKSNNNLRKDWFHAAFFYRKRAKKTSVEVLWFPVFLKGRNFD